MEPDSTYPIMEVPQRVVFGEEIDFRNKEVPRELVVERLCFAAEYFDNVAIAIFGGKQGGVRGVGLVEQVIGSAFQTYDNEDLYPDPFEKAAAIFRGIVQGHPFTDANKRTGFLTTDYFLTRMGYIIRKDLSIDQVYDFCLAVSSGAIRNIAEITQTIRGFWQSPIPEGLE